MKKLVALALALLVLGSMVGCSSEKSSDDDAEKTTTTEERSSSDDESDSAGDSGDSDGDDESDSGGDESGGDDSSSGVPMSMEDCIELSVAYGTIYVNALGVGLDDAEREELNQALDEIHGKIPPEIQDDLDVVREGLEGASSFREVTEFFESEEYREADSNITSYFAENCGPG